MFLIAASILVVIIDQISKAYIRSLMLAGDSIPLIPGILHITYVRNPGAAFGLFPNQQALFLIVSIAVIIFVVYYYWRAKAMDRFSAVALSLVLGGAIGNSIDRVVSGRVTDFIDLRVWPIFNIADTAIVIGAVMLGFTLIRSTDKESA